MWLAGMTEVLRASWQGTFAWMLRERGMAGAGVAIEPIINVGGWFVFYAMIMYFISNLFLFLVKTLLKNIRLFVVLITILKMKLKA